MMHKCRNALDNQNFLPAVVGDFCNALCGCRSDRRSIFSLMGRFATPPLAARRCSAPSPDLHRPSFLPSRFACRTVAGLTLISPTLPPTHLVFGNRQDWRAQGRKMKCPCYQHSGKEGGGREQKECPIYKKERTFRSIDR